MDSDRCVDCEPHRDMFGEDCVEFRDSSSLAVTVDGKTVLICLETRVSRQEPP